jgi:MFS transporter, SHS family, lactate transporter
LPIPDLLRTHSPSVRGVASQSLIERAETDHAQGTARGPGAWLPAFLAGLAGWTLDAFDFFLVVLSLSAIGHDFGENVLRMTLTLTATLVLRPVGAFFFGAFADRFGRRMPMIINLCLFAIVELATGFAHTFVQFLLIRGLFGVVMGGQWGVGVSLAMEEVPARYRGVLSGLLQQGYAIGFLLASGAYFIVMPSYGWRTLFYLGSLPALATALLIALRVRESQVWMQSHRSSLAGLAQALRIDWKLLLYFTFLMMAMHMCSHGTQDLYPTFLEKDWGIVARQRAAISAVSMVGAILGGLSIGWISDRVGRRRAMIGALAGALITIPLWAFASTLPMLVIGAVVMQFCVQGAWGVIPAHVSELSSDAVRSTVPGLANQLGVLLSSFIASVEVALAHGHSYAASMAITVAAVLCLAMTMTLAGHLIKPGSRR